MALACWQLTITDDEGRPVSGASVRVTQANGLGTGALATLKPARDGSGTLGNPCNADSEGFARFFVAQGVYDIRVSFAGSQRDHLYVALFEDTSLAYKPPVYQLATPNAGLTEDYAPPGFDLSTTFLDLVPGAGNAQIGGLAGMADGQRLLIRNSHASNTAELMKESAGTTAANRFSLPYDLTLSPGAAVQCEYIGAISRIVVCL